MNKKNGRVTCLLISNSPDVPEDFLEPEANSPYCDNKSALLFPMEMMDSHLWLKVCHMTEQQVTLLMSPCTAKMDALLVLMQELVDLCHSAEAPSGVPPTGVDSQLESTSSQDPEERTPRLLWEVSSIDHRQNSTSGQGDVEETFEEQDTAALLDESEEPENVNGEQTDHRNREESAEVEPVEENHNTEEESFEEDLEDRVQSGSNNLKRLQKKSVCYSFRLSLII